MKPIYEKFIEMVSFAEMWRTGEPDRKARNEIRTLKRHGIAAHYERIDDKTYRVIVETDQVPEINYLVLKRGFSLAKRKREIKPKSDLVEAILKRPRNGAGGGIPLTRGEVAMLFLDGYAGDFPGFLDIRSQGYGEDNLWDGLTTEDVLEDENTAFVWTKWEPLELWPEDIWKNRNHDDD